MQRLVWLVLINPVIYRLTTESFSERQIFIIGLTLAKHLVTFLDNEKYEKEPFDVGTNIFNFLQSADCVLYINSDLTMCTTFMSLEAYNTKKGIGRDGDSLNRR